MNLQKLINKLNKAEAEFLLRAMRQHSNAYYEYKNGKEYEETSLGNIYGDFAVLRGVWYDANEFTVLLANKIGLKEED